MLRKRSRISLLIVLALLGLLFIAIVLRMKAPPESARLLPESDAILYLDLKPFRAATHAANTPAPTDLDPAYQHFLDATGFHFERDLDEVAVALHQMPDPHGPNGPVAFSAVFVGRINRRQMEPYLASISTSRETYANRDIFSIPSDGRTVRVVFLGYDMVATSNMPTPEQIHSIVDRYHTAAMPSSGSSLLDERYKDVPLLSFAWGIGRLGLPFALYPPDSKSTPADTKSTPTTPNQIQIMGLTLPIPADATFIASIGFQANIAAAIGHSRAVSLNVSEITPDAATAQSTAQTLQALLNLYRNMQPPPQPGATPTKDEAALQQALRSLRIENHNNRVQITATATADLVHTLFNPTLQPTTITVNPPVGK